MFLELNAVKNCTDMFYDHYALGYVLQNYSGPKDIL